MRPTPTKAIATCIGLSLLLWTQLAADVGRPVEAPAANSAAAAVYPIDLSSALRLAARENPTIALLRERISENLALQQQADALLLPTLAAGGNLRIHRNALQAPDGQIFDVNSQSLYFGGGADAIGAQTLAVPAIRIFAPLGDAYLEPLVARQRVVVASATASGTLNTVLLEVTGKFLELEGASERLDALQQSAADVGQVVRTTAAFANVGQGRKADADRAGTRALLLRNEISRTQEQVEVASARLTRVLHLDPSMRLKPVSVPSEPVRLVDPSYDLRQLISIAVRARPEMAARAAAVEAAEIRYRQEQVRPFLPTISAGFSGGAFGGGSNLAPAPFDQFNGRTDFDVLAFWTVRNLGAGNVANNRQRRAEIGQAVSQRAHVLDRIGQEVADAYALSATRRQQITVTKRQLEIAARGFREELIRIQGGEGLPIEVLNSFELLSRARLDAINAVIEYDQAQFQLFVALGEPLLVDRIQR